MSERRTYRLVSLLGADNGDLLDGCPAVEAVWQLRDLLVVRKAPGDDAEDTDAVIARALRAVYPGRYWIVVPDGTEFMVLEEVASP